MTDVSLETPNRRTAIAAVQAEAARVGLDGDVLLDRRSFYDSVTALDPDAPGFRTQVRQMVASATGIARQSAPAPSGSAGGGEPRQWTMDDVDKSTPDECVAAINGGLLRDLGFPPSRKRR
jgi:lysozyme family protein